MSTNFDQYRFNCLAAEARAVVSETGLTPRQLAEQMAELLDFAKLYIKIFEQLGDRCNIVVREKKPADGSMKAALDGAVVFYGHWSGEEMPAKLEKALDRGVERWSDPSYLSRIIFCEFVGKDEFGDTTGFGIYAGQLGDNERPIMVVCVEDRTVTQYDENLGATEHHWSFADFPGTYAA